MPPRASGSLESRRRADGRVSYHVRVRLADGTRERVVVPEKYAGNEERRRLFALAVQEREDETGGLLAKKAERAADRLADRGTLAQYRSRLNEHRQEIGRGPGDPSAWSAWINGHLGGLPVAEITREQIESFRDVLDAEIARHKRTAGREGLSPKRALNVWAEVTTTFKAAVSAKRRDLRVRTDNPCVGVEPPERGDAKRKTFLYPGEVSLLLGCDQTPLAWREAYAVGAYLFLRPGELRALTWADVDLQARIVHVSKAWDERTSTVKSPKTGCGVRDVPIPGALVPLLERMRRGRPPEDAVVGVMTQLTENRRATNLRADLRRAGCTRPRLFENTATTMAVNFRSLRDSGITWLALSGVDVLKIQRRAGHESIETTLGYVKQAEDLTGQIGEPFGPLPANLVAGVEPDGAGGSRQRIAARVRANVRAKSPAAVTKPRKTRPSMEARAGLVPAPVFKTGGFVLRGAAGGFDSHALPPVFSRNSKIPPEMSPENIWVVRAAMSAASGTSAHTHAG